MKRFLVVCSIMGMSFVSVASQAYQTCELRVQPDKVPILSGDFNTQIVLNVEHFELDYPQAMVNASIETRAKVDAGSKLGTSHKRITHNYQLNSNREIRLDLSRPSNTIKTYLIDSKGLITPVTLTLSGLEDVGYRINGFKALRGKVEVNGEFEGERLNGGNVLIINPYCFLN